MSTDRIKVTLRQYGADNLATAKIIKADPEQYPGLPQLWVSELEARLQRERQAKIGPLFAQLTRRAA